jgi:cyclin B
VTLPGPVSKLKEKEVEEMEVAQIATKLAQQLTIPVDDIDTADSDNPQLCAEYVKDIYQYMRDLEVRSLNSAS